MVNVKENMKDLPKNSLYAISEAPTWAYSPNNDEIRSFVLSKDDDELVKEVKKQEKGICFIYRQIVNTSNENNHDYSLRVWSMNQPSILQSASINEINIRNNEKVIFHRVAVIRKDKLVDKIDNLIVRVIDDEQNSGQGLINKTKKVNFVIHDLHLGDVLILEYSKVSEFSSKDLVDKKYFRYIQELTSGFWLYVQYTFKVIQNRKEDIQIRKRYFRNEKGEIVEDTGHILKEGKEFIFEDNNQQLEYRDDRFNPYFEIATVDTWTGIGAYMYSLYDKLVNQKDFQKEDVEQELELTQVMSIDEKVRKVIEYVQDRIIYLFDAEIMHGHIPEPTQTVLTIRSGDCKTKSLLLMKMLDVIGVKSDLVLVNYDYDPYISSSLPSPFIFNHLILKIYLNNKEYFVDSTWSGRAGLIEYRTQPYFAHYLPIAKSSDLQNKGILPPLGILVEENSSLFLRKGKGRIETQFIYRRDSADIVRSNFRLNDLSVLIKHQNLSVANILQLNRNIPTENVFNGETYVIEHDDKEKNELKIFYTALISEPYIKQKSSRILKYYYPLNVDHFFSNHKDLLVSSFIAHPTKYTLTIKSDLFFKRFNETTVKQFEVDNKFFSLTNKKKIAFNTIKVFSEFKPKTYEVINSKDREELVKDIKQVQDSNFGIGVIYVSPFKFWFITTFIALYVLITIFSIVFGK